MSDPWSNIAASLDSGKLTLRRADTSHPLDFFRGRDHHGSYIFTLESSRTETSDVRFPGPMAIRFGIHAVSEERQMLVLTLDTREHVDLFRALTRDLMQATSSLHPEDSKTGFSIVLARLQRWQELLKALKQKVLSRNQIIGLFGEIVFLRDVVLLHEEPLNAVLSWRGPTREEQDFLVNKWSVELKTQLSTADSWVTIASENQLDPAPGKILLCHQTIGTADRNEASALTLNELVDKVYNLLKDHSDAEEHLAGLLLEAQYESRPEYALESWTMNTRRYFEVRDGFPAIGPAALPDGIDRVRYRLQLEACESFRVAESNAEDWLFEKDE